MAQLFVSHSSADNAFAAQVKEVLAGLGYASVFLDFDPTGGLVPGQAWRDQLFTNLDGCDAVVFITTPASVASQWCHSELALTRWLRKPVLALLVDGAAPHPLVADLQGLKVTTGALDPERVRAALVALGLEQEQRWDAGRSPYPGLRAFDESYAAVFFGRDRQVDQLRQLVDPPSRSREGAIVPVLGPSGSGKSSLVRAGLVPALRVSPDWVVTEPWTPADVPLAEMALALSHAAKQHGVDLDADRCAALLRQPGGMADYVRELRESGTAPADTKVLVVVDQAEELVTITSEEERKTFLEALTTGCAAPSPLRVVMTARTDMWDRVATEVTRFATTVAPTVLHVPPLSRLELAEVVSEPARRSHLVIEDGLVERLVEDTGSGDALPLLAFTLARLAAEAEESDDRRLTHAQYDAIGGVQGAIASRASEVAHGGRTEAQVAEAVLQLVNLTDATPHKRLARAADVPPKHREILDDLVDARLVVVNEVNGQPVYAPAHESLFSAWPPLVALIASRRDDLVLRGRLERRAADWREGGTTRSGLLAGAELDQAVAWRGRNDELLTADVRAFLDASRGERRRWVVVRSAVAAVVLALVATLVVVVAVNARADRRAAEQADVGRLAAIAERELVHDPAAAAAALLEGLALEPGDAQLQRLSRTLLRSPARDVASGADQTTFFNLAVGGPVSVVSATEGVIVWDSDHETTRPGPSSGALAVRGDGRVLVSADSPDGLSVYDLADGTDGDLEALTRFSFNDGQVPVIEFSPDGALLAEGRGAWVTLWDVRDPSGPRELATQHVAGGAPSALAVLDDGRVLSSAGTDRVVEWDALGTGRMRRVLSVSGEAAVTHLDVDAARTEVLVDSPTSFSQVPLVDLTSGTTLRSFQAVDPAAPESAVVPITWTTTMDAAGELVAAFDLAGRGYVFGVDDGALVTRLTGGHTSLVTEAGFTDDGLIVSASVDGGLRLWDARAAAEDTAGDLTDDLCRVFGGRLDADSWAQAFGDDEELGHPCPDPAEVERAPLAAQSSADLNAVPPVATPRSVVFRDDFDDRATTMFPTGDEAAGSGTLSRKVRGGEYRTALTDAGASFTATSTVPVTGLGDTWSVSATSTRGSGACGVVVGDGSDDLSATVDREAGTGTLTWSNRFGPGHTLPLAGPAGTDGELSIVGDRGVLAVLVGGRRVASVTDPTIGSPVRAGVVLSGDSSSCDYDDVTVATAQ